LETKFRPIPITILDFLGVLIPGYLWLILFLKTYDVLTQPTARTTGVMESFKRLSEIAAIGGNWLGPLAIVFAALAVGYTIKPIALRAASPLTKPFHILMRECKGTSWRSMDFPYTSYFNETTYYRKACQILAEVTSVDPQTFPRTGAFSGAKRYLHASAPSLWEESERMEAEVRMLGALFLAAIYSFLLHGVLAVAGLRQGLVWMILSLLVASVLALGLNIVRFREAAYTYINVVLAAGIQKSLRLGVLSSRTATDKEDGS
jgi:hypothetical protein